MKAEGRLGGEVGRRWGRWGARGGGAAPLRARGVGGRRTSDARAKASESRPSFMAWKKVSWPSSPLKSPCASASSISLRHSAGASLSAAELLRRYSAGRRSVVSAG